MLNGIGKVQARIQAIESRFRKFPAGDFKSTLEAKLQGNTSVESGQVQNVIMKTARQYGVDPKVALAVAKAESNFDQSSISPTGAVGVMQLMPDTARALGVNAYDTKDNIEGGVRYLKQMLTRFNNSVPLALAAYNAGPQSVIDYGGVPPYQETQNYVKRVLDFAKN